LSGVKGWAIGKGRERENSIDIERRKRKKIMKPCKGEGWGRCSLRAGLLEGRSRSIGNYETQMDRKEVILKEKGSHTHRSWFGGSRKEGV